MRDLAEFASVVDTFLELGARIQPWFPHHAEAMFGEIVDTKVTNERWLRVSKILASVRALPGVCLLVEEHEARSLMLVGLVIAQKMAHATFGGAGSDEAGRFAQMYAGELKTRLGMQ